MSVSFKRRVRAALLGIGVVGPSVNTLAADDVATLAFNNRTWGNPTAWTHSNPAANGTVPNNSREFDYDVVISRTVDLDLDVTIEKGLFDGGQISDTAANPNTLRFNDVFTFRNGFLQANTTAAGGIVFDNATGNPFVERANLQNLAMANWTAGNVSPIGGGGITNAAGATFYARADAANLSYFSNDLTGFFNNQGTFVKRGPFRTDIRATFDNAADVNVEAGELRFVANSFGTGRFNVAPGATVSLSSGMCNMRGSAIFAGEGLLEVGQFGDFHVGQAAAPADASVSKLSVLRGGLRIIPGSALTLTGGGFFDRAVVDGAGTMKIAPGVDVRAALGFGPMAITQTVVENEGELTVVGGGSNSLALQNDARISNKFGGVLNLDATAAVVSTTLVPGSIVNRGTMNVRPTAQGGTATLLNVDLQNHGNLNVRRFSQMEIFDAALEQLNGVMNVERDASLVLLNAFVTLGGGLLQGEGEIQSNTPVRVGTTPGSTMRVSPGQTPGKLTIRGELTMGDAVELFAELGGRTQVTQYDVLDVIGTAALGGDLLVDLIDGFEFSILPTDVFTVLTADAPLTGAFDNVASGGRVTGVDGFATFQVSYGVGSPFDANDVVLSNVAFIPEPATCAAVCVAAGMLSRRRRR